MSGPPAPATSAALFEAGKARFRLREFAAALDLFEQALQGEPGQSECWWYLGEACERVGNFRRMEEAFQSLLRRAGDDVWLGAWALFGRGKARFGQRRHESAIEDFTQAELLGWDEFFYGPGCAAEMFLFRARAHEALGQFAQAAAAFRSFQGWSGQRGAYQDQIARLETLAAAPERGDM